MAKVNVVKIIHPKFGELLHEAYDDSTQFKLALNLIHNSLELKNDFDSFNGVDFLIHIPYENLRECFIIGNSMDVSLADYAIQKSKMEGSDVKTE